MTATQIAFILLPLLIVALHLVKGVHSHALWQQVVQAEQSDSESGSSSSHHHHHHAAGGSSGPPRLATVFTFSEKPGVANAKTEGTDMMDAVGGAYAYLRGTDDEFTPLVQIHPRRAGPFFVAELPPGITTSISYGLESVLYRGLYGDGGEQTRRNSVYYTSAPDYGYQSPAQVATKLRTHAKLRIDLVDVARVAAYDTQHGFYQSACGGNGGGSGNSDAPVVVCLAARVVFDGRVLAATPVKVYHGDTGETMDTHDTNDDGIAHFAVRLPGRRVFAKVSYDVLATPGSKTRDGGVYDETHYVATTVLELAPVYEAYPANATTTTVDSETTAVVTQIVQEAIVGVKETTRTKEEEEGFNSGVTNNIGNNLTRFMIVLVSSMLGGIISSIFVARFWSRTYSPAPSKEVAGDDVL